MHIFSNYNMFQEESCLHQRVLFSEYGSLSWKNITLCIQRIYVQLWRTYFQILHAYMYHVFFIEENILWKGHCMCNRVYFWHTSRLRHVLLYILIITGMLYHLTRNTLVEGSTHFKEMHHSLSRESSKVFEHVLT